MHPLVLDQSVVQSHGPAAVVEDYSHRGWVLIRPRTLRLGFRYDDFPPVLKSAGYEGEAALSQRIGTGAHGELVVGGVVGGG